VGGRNWQQPLLVFSISIQTRRRRQNIAITLPRERESEKEKERKRERERERDYLEYDRHSLCLETVGRGGGGGRQTERQTELQSGRENPSLSDCNDFIVLRRLKLSWNVPGIEYPCFFTTHDLTDISSK
jgi:hypothetical protein